MIPPAVVELADWSEWRPLVDAAADAPTSPGVYLARQGDTIVYVGMAGERRGKGLGGRLNVYVSGKGLASGLGEAVFDRALADPEWLRERLAEAEDGQPHRAKVWGKLALAWSGLDVCWARTATGPDARALEHSVIQALHEVPLWNRRR